MPRQIPHPSVSNLRSAVKSIRAAVNGGIIREPAGSRSLREMGPRGTHDGFGGVRRVAIRGDDYRMADSEPEWDGAARRRFAVTVKRVEHRGECASDDDISNVGNGIGEHLDDSDCGE